MHSCLVIGLNYSKAPFSPFPKGLHDVEALMLAAFRDGSLPIDKKRGVGVVGFSAGGNLALAVCQLPSIHNEIKPQAVAPIYPPVDLSVGPAEKIKRRYYKTGLSAGLRSATSDYLLPAAPSFDWSYIPYHQDLRDPLLSPIYADRGSLPPHIFVVGCELDMLGHEAWRFACKLTGRPEPKPGQKPGQQQPATEKGHLILTDEQFAFEQVQAGDTSIRWLLIPDQVHGFDHISPRMHGSEESVQDAESKTEECQAILGDWLVQKVWRQQSHN
jgi:acetyl esterase/lipase